MESGEDGGFEAAPPPPAGRGMSSLAPLDLADVDPDAPLELGPQDKLSHGVLRSGLRYYVRSNAKPAARAALALVVRVGSLAEAEAERGVAHFLEHLAFNATELFDHHALVGFLEASGLAFGACQNASTSCEETLYELLVPTDRDGLLHTALRVLAQFAHRIRVAPGDVDAERGAILEEWRQGRDARGRAAEAAWRLTYAGSAYAERLPIGLESVIRGVDAATIRGFYEKFYRPEHMALVAVGDWDAEAREAVVAAVRAAFDGIMPPEGAPAAPPPLPAPAHAAHAAPRAACIVERQLTDSAVSVSFTAPAAPLRSAADLRRRIVADLFQSCLSARLFRASRGASPPFYTADVALESSLAAIDATTLSATAPVGGMLGALRALLLHLAAVRAHGFAAAEVRRARARLEADVAQAWTEREQAYSTTLRDEYARHFLLGEAVLHPDLEARLQRALLRDITDADVAALAAPLTADRSCVIVATCGAAERRPPTEAELLAVLREVEALEAAGQLPAVAEADAAPEALLPAPPAVTPAAAVAARAAWPGLGVTELRLRNGLRVALKRTPFLDDQVLFSAFAHGGLSQVAPAGGDYPSAACAALLAGEAGVFGHRPETLEDLLAGRRCVVSPALSAYRRDVSGDASPEDLDIALQLLHLLYTRAPSAPPELLATPLRLAAENIRAQHRDPGWRFSTAVKALNYGECYYLRPMTLAGLAAVRPDEALAVFDRAFRNPAEFTLCLVGALPEDEAALEALLTQWLGTIPEDASLPPRAPSDIAPLPWRFPAAPARREVRVRMPEPQAAAQLTWPLALLGGAAGAAAAGAGRREQAALLLRQALSVRCACCVLESRLLKVMRFRFGDVYSVAVSPYWGLEAPSATPPLRGDCAVSFSCDPAAAWRLVELALDELAALQSDGPSADDCATAVELEKRAHELSVANNTFWLQRMVACYQSARFDGDVDACHAAHDAARDAVLSALTPEALRDVYRTLWPHPARGRYTAVTLLPARTLTERAAAAHAAAAAAWADASAAKRTLVAAAVGGLAAALVYTRWRAWRRA